VAAVSGQGELDSTSMLPRGPYGVSMTKGPRGELSIPYTVTCGTGQAVAGHVPSRPIAEAIAKALNALYQH
jgi:hypothetical protein